jgi:hypothetical protein
MVTQVAFNHTGYSLTGPHPVSFLYSERHLLIPDLILDRLWSCYVALYTIFSMYSLPLIKRTSFLCLFITCSTVNSAASNSGGKLTVRNKCRKQFLYPSKAHTFYSYTPRGSYNKQQLYPKRHSFQV